jgi:hypothetical protein
MVDCGKLGSVASRSPSQLCLRPHRSRVRSTVGGYFRARWPRSNAMRPAVVADAVVDDGAVDDYGAVVDVGDVDAAEVVDGAVVGEVISMPVSALIANAGVAEAVVHPAIEADVPAPITVIEAIASTDEAPVGRRPQCSLIGRCNPRSWNPVVTASAPAPVARSPEIARLRNGWLLILRERRGRLLCVLGRRGIVVGITVVLVGVVLVALHLVAFIVRRLRSCLRRRSRLLRWLRRLARCLRCCGGVRGYGDRSQICISRVALILRIIVRRCLGLV